MASNFIRHLLKIARVAVDMVTNQINQNLNTITSEVQSPLQSIVGEVVGGVWQGQGADKFVQEISNLVLPRTSQVMDSCTVTIGSIHTSIEIIYGADAQVRGLVDDLDNTFQNIYHG